jgi:anaerobic selenocysteine-containing dehydrogenase
MDGNTRLCTATAAAALKASFGTDGQPGSYTDVDHCDADVHLALRPGTNVALMNGILHLVILNGWIDRSWIDSHTIGFESLAQTVEHYDPKRVAEICDVDAGALRAAAELVGTADRLLSTVLQGFYQSNQATAAACQVNNLHLLRAMIGRPGAGIYQMNGQPTAQNTRETGADGDLPGFRNWDNAEHVRQLADLWNVEPWVIPHWSPPTHAMQVFRYAEQGSIELLWISATNPAVSLPDLSRIRALLAKPELFVVVQDAFLTETARMADVVLPAAIWGEKTGTFTNVDRTVHLSDQAIEPPGQARSDLDIFLDYAARMDLRDRDGEPLIGWSDAEGGFEAGRPVRQGGPVTTPASPTNGSEAAAASSGPAPRRPPAAPNGSTPMAASTPTRTTARPTDTTSSPVRRTARSTTGPASPKAGPSFMEPSITSHRRCPTPTTRSR